MNLIKNATGLLKSLFKRITSLKFSTKAAFIFMGISSTLWFLIRVIPKPQRAGYPCMKAAAPIISGFVVYLLTLGGSVVLLKKAIRKFKQAKYLGAALLILVGVVLVFIWNIKDAQKVFSNPGEVTFTRGVLPDAPNSPVGEGRGIFPGRVTWIYNRYATNENCPNTITNAYFMAKNTNQDTINRMADRAIKSIGGKNTVSESWDAIFRDFNKRKTGTASGYVAGQKIVIKINNGQAGWAIDNNNLAETGVTSSGTGKSNVAMSNTSPQAVLAFLVQLIDSCCIAQTDIEIGEPMTHIYKSLYDIVHPKYPNVILLDKSATTASGISTTTLGRTVSAGWTNRSIIWSDKGKVMNQAISDDLMNEMYNADYMINIAVMKAHARSGVTLCAKNHFGSSTHGGSYSAERLHAGSINVTSMSSSNGGNDNLTNARGDYHMYRVLTDIIGHDKLGGNTVLFVVDGLWGGIEATDMPVKWQMAPFYNDFPSSLFVSQDEVALESVCLDFLRAEASVDLYMKDRPFFPGVDDYLHQAATRADWPESIISLSGKWYTFAGYDPEGDGTLMKSMGIHEHWNNSTNKQYSRNLYSNGTGIELVSFPQSLVAYGNGTALNLTVSVTDTNGPVEGAIIVVNGSNYMTDSEGKTVIGDLTVRSALNYSVRKTGYNTETGLVDISADKQLDVVLTESHTGISSAKANELTISAYPNPVTDECEITYSLNSKATVFLMITSLDGKIIDQSHEGQLASGKHTWKFNAENLSSGLYVCVLKAQYNDKTEVKTIKLQVK